MNQSTVERLNTALSGRYRIERQLGEGGMATVHLAEDLRHQRKVALKVLKPELAAVVGGDRFLAEIRTTANLQHPHILPLFDSGEADGFLFYVMPYVEGESLRERLDREHQLPVDDAVLIATDMAEALNYAHRQGVIHRDIKPANVLLLDGAPVISDFGIALAVGAAGGGRLTETGLSLGTPHYMSPEQATGDVRIGPAADVYALGCVLYEMLVGEPPFTGSTPQAVLGKIITGSADPVIAHRRAVPRNVSDAVDRALEKLPADRFRDAGELAEALGDPTFRYGAAVGPGVAPESAGRWKATALAMTALFVLAAGVAAWSLTRSPPPGAVARFPSPFLEGQLPFGPMELTSDGSALVYTGPDASDEGSRLWVRRWDDLSANPVPGTDGARWTSLGQISLSPDEREVAFTTGNPGALRIVPLDGGPGRTLVDAASAVGGWSDDGWIYFQTVGEAIRRVPARGGEPETLTERSEGDLFHTLPTLLPGERTLVFQVFRASDGSDAEIWWLDIESGNSRYLIGGSSPRWVPTGHLLFGTFDGTLVAAPLDVEAGELTGPAISVVEGMLTDPLRGVVHYDVSETGTLVYRAGAASAQGRYEFVWIDRNGQATPVDAGHTFQMPAQNFGWRLSPDETRIVFNSLVDSEEDIRIKHLPDGPEERITFTEHSDIAPFWAPDGESVTYFSGPVEDRNIVSRRADGSGEPVVLVDDVGTYAQGSWSPDGEWLVLRTGATAATGLGLRDIVAIRPGVDSAPQPLVATPDFAEIDPVLSPEGRWLAYASNETGTYEIYVRPFPDVGASRVRVSTDGGIAPRWSGDGRELFFASPGGMMSATFDPESERVGELQLLFVPAAEYPAAPGSNFYDVSSDGQRFLMVRPIGAELADRLIVVQNFLEELRARVGG